MKNLPDFSDFSRWSQTQIYAHTQGKSIVYAPGGTSRWYFIEKGLSAGGYNNPDQFYTYAAEVTYRIIEQVGMMCDDGIATVFVPAHMPDGQNRTEAYNRALPATYQIPIDEISQKLYEEHRLQVQFRGDWAASFERLNVPEITERFMYFEQTTPPSDRRLVWLTREDDPIPHSLLPMLIDRLDADGKLPDRASLAEAYYGYPIQHVDIFLGHNKFSVFDLQPPLLTLGDVYFSVNPSLYIDQRQWRHVLYDHLFARKRHYRTYESFTKDMLDDVQDYSRNNQGFSLGVGEFHEASQTWRPFIAPPDNI